MGSTIIVNIFSPDRAAKQSMAWKLALALTQDGMAAECLPGYYPEFQSGISDAQMELRIRKLKEDIELLKESADVVISYNPLLSWKLCRNLDVQFNNQVDDMLFLHNNFNVYLKPPSEGMQDLRIKSLLVSSGEGYGEYKGESITLLAGNVKKAHERINADEVAQQMPFASRCYQHYANLKKLLDRYSMEAPGFHDLMGRLKDGGMASAERMGEHAYNIKYQNISVVYNKCTNYDMGILSNNYCGFESVDDRTGRHRYDFKQQTEYRNRLRKLNFELEP